MQTTETICYDDACHLKKYANNPARNSLTATTRTMAGMEMVVDKFHFPNHVDRWCKTNCNPYNTKCFNCLSNENCLTPFLFDFFRDVNTEVCEQLFSWLSRFSIITKHMNRWRFLFLMSYLLDQHNEDIANNKQW
ncbi:unnamed protein product [Porites evermanni]|uniref:Uncharacterized protein n=1 Tax=Porites evermanni TaxID=104178 RepID=A0ABN8PE94_9CNID|nr:unnamed protein product [Porites evermanni]